MTKFSAICRFCVFLYFSPTANAVQPSIDERLKSCDPSIAVAAADEFVGNPSSAQDPAQLFTAAKIFLENKREDDAVFWYFAAKLRFIHLIAGNENNQNLTMMLGLGAPILEPHIRIHALKNLQKLGTTTDRLIAWNNVTYDQYKKHDLLKAAKLDADIQQLFAILEHNSRDDYRMAGKVFRSNAPDSTKQAWDAALRIGYGASVSVYPNFEGLRKLSASANEAMETDAKQAATVSEYVFYGLRANCPNTKIVR
jgi:hypothetical protein